MGETADRIEDVKKKRAADDTVLEEARRRRKEVLRICRAFPGVPVRTSGRDEVLATVPDEAAVVVATPGAEPVPEKGGYGAVLLLDTWALLTRADLRAVADGNADASRNVVAAIANQDTAFAQCVADGNRAVPGVE